MDSRPWWVRMLNRLAWYWPPARRRWRALEAEHIPAGRVVPMSEPRSEHEPVDKCPVCRVSPCYCEMIVDDPGRVLADDERSRCTAGHVRLMAEEADDLRADNERLRGLVERFSEADSWDEIKTITREWHR